MVCQSWDFGDIISCYPVVSLHSIGGIGSFIFSSLTFFLQPVFAALSAYLVLSPAAKRGNLQHKQHLSSTFHLASGRAVDIEERPGVLLAYLISC